VAEPWEPTLEQVATRVPTRTRDASVPGEDQMLVTFNAETTPTEEQARRFIAAAVVEVLSAVAGTIPTSPQHVAGMATDAAAWRAAADIELAYPLRDGDLAVYTQLDARAQAAFERLVAAVDDAGSGPEGSLLPVYAFPEPGWPGDYPI
jgi:membrane peptidoglycan carboxypeptidase